MTEPQNFMLDRDAVLKGIVQLPSLPAVVIDLLQSMKEDSVDVGQLAAKLARDQALSAKILRIANSSFYGLRGQVDSIADATVVLGLNSVRMLATAAAVGDAFAQVRCEGFEFRGYWRHCIATALCTRELARQRRMNEGNAFAAGLLHDIGVLALVSCFPQHFAAVNAYQTQQHCVREVAEKAVLGLDHADLGRILTEYWCFPPLLCEVIGAHHAPESSSEPLARLVHIANALVEAINLGPRDGELKPLLDEESRCALGFSEASWAELCSVLETQFDSACEALSPDNT